MVNDTRRTLRWRFAVALALTVGVVAGCRGGPSDVVGGGGLAGAHTTITLVAYSVAEPGWSKVIPAFNGSEEGKGVQVITSFGASGDQSRGVAEESRPTWSISPSNPTSLGWSSQARSRRTGIPTSPKAFRSDRW